MKKPLITLAALVVLAVLFFAFNSFIYNEKQGTDAVVEPSVVIPTPSVTLPPVNVPKEIQGKWRWKQTLHQNGEKVFPKKVGAFTITLGEDATIVGTTDCNGLNGSFTVKNKEIKFGPIGMTKMFCEASQDVEFAKMLEDSTEYLINPSGELVLGLKFDSGSVVFEKI